MRIAETARGAIAYIDEGEGPVAVFVHGVFMNSFLWRKVVAALAPERRCIAVDLPAHGASVAAADQDLSLTANADLLAALLDELAIDRVDLVGNDTGGALCQIFAVRHGARVRTLTLTNTDAHDNLPPAAFAQGKAMAAAGKLAESVNRLAKDPQAHRGVPGLGQGFADPHALSDDEVAQLGPGVFADPDRARAVQRFVTATKVDDLLAVEDALGEMRTPTLIVWGTDDIFFEVDWAYWLRDHIPGAREVVEIDGGMLFFPYEHADRFVEHLRPFLDEHSPRAATAETGAS